MKKDKLPELIVGITTVSALDRFNQIDDIDEFFSKYEKDKVSGKLTDHLNALLIDKNITIADIARELPFDRTYLYQIFNGRKKPSRDKLIGIAFGMKLSLEETNKLLKVSGNRELYVKDKRDAVIMYAIKHKNNVTETNLLLDKYEMELLE